MIPFGYTLGWPSLSKAFADRFRQDRSPVPITTPDPCAVLQPEDIVSMIAVACLHGIQSVALKGIANHALAKVSYFLSSPISWQRRK